MKIIEINSCDYGSTGKVMLQIAGKAIDSGLDSYVAIPKGRHNWAKKYKKTIWIGNRISEDSHLILSRLTGFNGCFSVIATKIFLWTIRRLRFDIAHFHNLHNSYINLPMLFKYIKKNNIPVVWTLHDCWAFTGQCPHFTFEKCEKWKTRCHNCPRFRKYPEAYVDRTKTMWRLKKKWFTGVENLTIVTPSQWLGELLKQSYLKDYPVRVINNGIDLSVFKPTESNFRNNYKIGKDKFILLGVAFNWGIRKGLDVFVELSRRLDNDKFQIIIVGTTNKVVNDLPSNILTINKTNNQKELAEIYSAADLLCNPTREDNYPTVNMESIACGTPVLTFKTGGSPEILTEKTGVVVDYDDIDTMEYEIQRIYKDRPYSEYDCQERAKSFDLNVKLVDYVYLYKDIMAKL